MVSSILEKKRDLWGKMIKPVEGKREIEDILDSGVSNPIAMADFLANDISPETPLAGIGNVEIGSYYSDLVYIFGVATFGDSAARLIDYLLNLQEADLGYFINPYKDMLHRPFLREHIGSVFIFGFSSPEWGMRTWGPDTTERDLKEIASDAAFRVAYPGGSIAERRQEAAKRRAEMNGRHN